MPRKQKQQGGMSTSDWGVKVFGSPDQQTAVPGTNVVAIKGGEVPDATKVEEVVTPLVDESNKPVEEVVAEPAVGGNLAALVSPQFMTPVVLTVASNEVAKRLKTRKTRGGDMTTVAVPAMLVLANNQLHKLLRKPKSVKGGRRGRKTQKK